MQVFKKKTAGPSLILLLLSACLAAVLAACGGLPVQTGDTGSGNPISLTPSGSSPQGAVIALKHDPTGTSDLSWDPKEGTLSVKVELTGLAPNSTHAAHIHAGVCGANGAIVYPLTPIVADAKGAATTETKIEHVKNGIPAQGWYINVHNGTSMAAIEDRPIACGNVSNPSASQNDEQTVHVTLSGTSAPNESASGQAQLGTDNGKTTLKITLSGLEPNSSHIAHIHAGSCEAQGAVLVTLSPVVADAKGNGTSVTTLDHLPSSPNGMYINVHTGSTMAQLSQSVLFNPIACGNVSLS